MSSVQSHWLFLYYVVFSIMSVQYCLCISKIQCPVSVYSVSSARFYSVQCKQCSEPIASVSFFKCSVCRVESVAYIVNGVQCQLGYSLGHSWSAYYYSVWVVFSLVFSCQWGSESIAFSVSSVSVAFRVLLFSGSFSVCTLQCLQCQFRALAVHQESVMLTSCSESTL